MDKDTDQNKFLIITANIGSLFEEYGRELQPNWVKSFHQLVAQQKPLFIALHFQEIGGKADYQSKENVASYFRSLYASDAFNDFTCTCSYVDQEFDDNTKYTALGCSYFIHKSLEAVEQWNFNHNCFSPVVRKRQLQGISEDVGTIRKFKFPISCFSKKVKRLPRKGFTWTRWKIQNKVIDMLNLHLTHDASNVYCALKSPTKYSKHRRRAFEYAIERLYELESDHQILFGDFNVRPDTKGLIEHLMNKKATRQLLQDSNGEPYSVIYNSLDGLLELLKIENRFFEMSSYEAFNSDKVPDIIKFDKELQWLKEERQFRELPVTFQPTYPHKEDPEDKGTTFANVRCPSWCDRVIFDSRLFDDVIQKSSNVTYNSFGTDVCLGDHKPVFLTFNYPGVLADQ